MNKLKEETIASLVKSLREKEAALLSFWFEKSGAKAKNRKEGTNLRKDIARIKTELSARRNAQTA